MPKTTRRIYSEAEKALLVGEVQRLYARGDATMRSVAKRLGISEATYYGWVKAGVRAPRSGSRPAPVKRTADERRQVVEAVATRVAARTSVVAASMTEGVMNKSYRLWRQTLGPMPLREVEVTACPRALRSA